MTIELKSPTFPESVIDGEVALWHKRAGDAVQRDETLVEIETDKVTMAVPAPVDGVLTEILKQVGTTVSSRELLGRMEATAADTRGADADAAVEADTVTGADAAAAANSANAAMSLASPAARRILAEKKINPLQVAGSGKDGRITKNDLVRHLQQRLSATAAAAASASAARPAAAAAPTHSGERVERRVPMTRMRKRIAERLLSASRETAMLSTFNEVNMAPVMALRSKYRESFERAHKGTRLGFMGFFVKAVCEALKRFPVVNACIDGDDIVYHGYQDIGVAVSTDNGLVVPVLRDADFMSVADIEARVRDYALRARSNKLSMEEMTGGTFTVTNGGVYGSLLSTPILNPPQSAILGMHKIQERPMAVNGELCILPMMYLALSYDHRLIDGKDAVQFLLAIKYLVEDPARILLQL